MPALLFAFLTSALAMIGARSTSMVARLSDSFGAKSGLLIICWVSTSATAALAAWAGSSLAPRLAAPAREIFTAAAFAIAAAELLFFKMRTDAIEPTRSLGAISLVLAAGQVTDAARFLVLALAIVMGSPAFAAVGGAVGSGIVLTGAWALGGHWETYLPQKTIRLAAGASFILVAIVVALASQAVP